jgi:NAD-dependent deacetylase
MTREPRTTTPPAIVVLTGAGISAESGLPTFRAADGLWEGHRVEDVASPEGFWRNPELVHRFYNLRRAALATVKPNAAHEALVRLERAWPGEFLLVTQNVDDLHDRAGSRRLFHMHGELLKARCVDCDLSVGWTGGITVESRCPGCGAGGSLRPDIVWFGEMPWHMEEISAALRGCGIFIAVGTSGLVYPAAGFVEAASAAGARTIEVNLAGTAASDVFDERRTGPATVVLPPLVEELLKERA